MESDYILAEMIQARINTRESSTLTIATVAASASLVLLAVSASPSSYTAYTHHSWLRLAGFLFALLGVLYRETTILTLDTRDYVKRNQILSTLKQGQLRSLMSDKTAPGQFLRGLILRVLLLSPFAAWSNLLFHSLQDIGSYYLSPDLLPVILPFLFWSIFFPQLKYGRLWHKLLALIALLIAFITACGMLLVLLTFPPIVISTDSFALTGGLYVVLTSIALTWIDEHN